MESLKKYMTKSIMQNRFDDINSINSEKKQIYLLNTILFNPKYFNRIGFFEPEMELSSPFDKSLISQHAT